MDLSFVFIWVCLELELHKKITDTGLQALAPLVALQMLELSYCEMFTKAGLQANPAL